MCRLSHKEFDFPVVLQCEEKAKDGERGERGCVLEGLQSTGVRSGPGIRFIRGRGCLYGAESGIKLYICLHYIMFSSPEGFICKL